MNEETQNRQLITIPKGNKYFDKIKWVARAISKDATRHVITFLWCDIKDGETNLVATNGGQIHKLLLDTTFLAGLTHGAYKVKISASEILLLPANEGINYPNWRQVIPGAPPADKVISGKVAVDKQSAVSRFTAYVNSSINGEKTDCLLYNDTFLADLLGSGTLYGARGEMVWEYETEFNGPCVVKSDDLLGVIMPMRRIDLHPRHQTTRLPRKGRWVFFYGATNLRGKKNEKKKKISFDIGQKISHLAHVERDKPNRHQLKN